jgi:succinoglycan biosynthesis transport protein ExoP
MINSGNNGERTTAPPDGGSGQLPLEHFLRLLMHRKWWTLGVWLVVSVVTAVIAYRLPDVYTSETVILVDPQKVPESYVKPTVTGDVRSRLGTLSQQILSATRLQTIIETLNLYPEERSQNMAREDVISKMKSDISVRVVSDFTAGQDLQAFRIAYSGKDPRLVAQVTNQLASHFINENLKVREQQSKGTADFLDNQLQSTRQHLEEQEAKLRDFKLKHIGEMPKQETADLQLLGQAQSQLQMEADSLSRAEQQKTYLQSMIAQTAPMVDIDPSDKLPGAGSDNGSNTGSRLARDKAALAQLMKRYTEDHPDVRKLKKQIEDEEAQAALAPAQTAASVEPVVKRPPPKPANHTNPVLQSQLNSLDSEIAKHKEEKERLSRLVSLYRAKLDAIPLREQEITALERDYEISKAHYSQLLEKHLSAQTATQLEVRQKGEKFEILDPAVPAERPSKPNRMLINFAGSLGGLVLGLLLALGREFFGMSIVGPQDIAAAAGLLVLGEIPIIMTQADQKFRRRWILVATTTVMVAALATGAVLFYHYRVQI